MWRVAAPGRRGGGWKHQRAKGDRKSDDWLGGLFSGLGSRQSGTRYRCSGSGSGSGSGLIDSALCHLSSIQPSTRPPFSPLWLILSSAIESAICPLRWLSSRCRLKRPRNKGFIGRKPRLVLALP